MAFNSTKPTNPKDAIGIRKWRQFATIPVAFTSYVGAALLEGALKYGRHNYRVGSVLSSVYYDAAIGHLMQWWEGEDIDADSQLPHLAKAAASIAILIDAEVNDFLNDDRPPPSDLTKLRNDLQRAVDSMIDKYPEPVAPSLARDSKLHPTQCNVLNLDNDDAV